MKDELASLRAHGTWQLVARAKAKKHAFITIRWVFVVKCDAQERIQRFKDRLVIHVPKQKYDVYYVETFTPVIRYVRQYDVKAAFMYGQLTELIFMEQPVEFEENGGQLVCQLVKSLYGLKQVLPQDSDYRLYAKYDSDGDVQMLLTVYVEDLLLMRPSDLCAKVANQLKGVFSLTSMGESISGYITFLDGNAISYGSRKQGTNAHSSTETEYVDMNERVKDILWTDGLLEELR
ncbi:Retrotransposon Tca5 Polyprotein [Phytophthora megakarya]|uniref:Retrotransposon Tca5 Polyprotein n=1 Tax=Phytophthora megakarya TaxID=4795 RepID=A0A225UYF1_9STRA|nr:Retrotransposon Tca5 Polyprotein [Phytophthora megakarya]